jgi:hypothetical protein
MIARPRHPPGAPHPTASPAMKIRLTTVVDVDPEKWAKEYGIAASEVRDDVKGYFANFPQEQVNSLGLAPEVPK